MRAWEGNGKFLAQCRAIRHYSNPPPARPHILRKSHVTVLFHRWLWQGRWVVCFLYKDFRRILSKERPSSRPIFVVGIVWNVVAVCEVLFLKEPRKSRFETVKAVLEICERNMAGLLNERPSLRKYNRPREVPGGSVSQSIPSCFLRYSFWVKTAFVSPLIPSWSFWDPGRFFMCIWVVK